MALPGKMPHQSSLNFALKYQASIAGLNRSRLCSKIADPTGVRKQREAGKEGSDYARDPSFRMTRRAEAQKPRTNNAYPVDTPDHYR
jgi:hypothetical protein